ncbi:MAG: type II toxin-antitoxin system HicB family antitoxin [Candidatus Dadabacteria bacterium]|nr:type II toxin-antitoxin system HicB family antitoxin [Candidatus Dadabacteria bacterium]
MNNKVIKFRVHFCVEPDGDLYYAYCPELRGVHEEGETPEIALENARESARACIISILEHNDPLPLSTETHYLEETSNRKNPTTQVEDLSVSFAYA